MAIREIIDKMLDNFVNEFNREDVKKYIFVRERIDKVKAFTIRNDVQSLLALDKYLQKKTLDKVTQDDMLKFEEFLTHEYQSDSRTRKKKKGVSKSTIELYEIRIKRFYKYFFNKNEYKKGRRFQKDIPYPECVGWITYDGRNQKKLPLDYILTDKQILKMLNVCSNARDQAIIVALYDGGLRNSELLSLNVKSVGFDKLGAYFLLPEDGDDLKTGARKVRLFLLPSSVHYIKTFINTHPFKDYPNAPLFFTRMASKFSYVLNKVHDNTVKQGDFEKARLSRNGLGRIIKDISTNARLPISLTPHKLRHNSCTRCSKVGFNEMESRIRYGWSPTSKMPSRYTHLASKDIDDKIKVITGFKEPETPEDSILQPILCWNCHEDNEPTNKFCNRCGSNLNPTKEELTMDAPTTGLSVQEMMKDPEFLIKFGNLLAEEYAKHQAEKP